jgi:glucose/mannose-6-phosphate isomerase
MYQLIKDFPAQLSKAIEIGESSLLKDVSKSEIRNIVISGLGGSGIGGNVLSELLRESLGIPVVVSKSYFLPAFINETTLLILTSYSGNTEETVSCAEQAIAKGLKPVCITSGGRLEELALSNSLHLMKIPSGFPPRTCLGYSTTLLFYVLHIYGLIDDAFKTSIKHVVELLNREQAQVMEDAEFLSAKLIGKVIVVYAEDKYESTALRVKQQINENSKLHCWYNVIPEMNHNELVGWREQNDALAVLIFRADDELPP